MRELRRRYGASLWHLALLAAAFVVAGYAATKLVTDRPLAVAMWFVGAAVVHDLVLVPSYAVLDTLLRRRRRGDPPAWLNYVRFPAAISALLLLVFLPSIARLSGRYAATTGLSSSGYLLRWLAITASLFVVSAVVYAVRVLRRSR